MTIRTPICDLLGIEHPVLLAGMGGVAYAEVCAAVSNAGGFGSLGMAGLGPEQIRAQMRRVRELTTIAVPASWETQFPELRGKAGTAIYQRTFSVPNRLRARLSAAFRSRRLFRGGLGQRRCGWNARRRLHPLCLSDRDCAQRVRRGRGSDRPCPRHRFDADRRRDAPQRRNAALCRNPARQAVVVHQRRRTLAVGLSGSAEQTHIDRAVFLPDIDAGTAQVEFRVVGAESAEGWQARIVVDAPKGAGASNRKSCR